MDKISEGKKVFLDDKFHCSQAVVGVYPEIIDTNTALKLGSCFGGGMRVGEMCGAIVGALMIMGLKTGYSNKDDLEHKKLSNEKTVEIINRFKEKYGSYNCRDLRGSREKCAEYVGYAIELVEELGND